jgi:hypothetical protein
MNTSLGKMDTKSGQQLERVQRQNAELVMQNLSSINQFRNAHEQATFDCGLEECAATYALQRISPRMQPYVAVINVRKPEMMKRAATSPFYYTLPPVDLARLATDPTKQARWINLVIDCTYTTTTLARARTDHNRRYAGLETRGIRARRERGSSRLLDRLVRACPHMSQTCPLGDICEKALGSPLVFAPVNNKS